MRAKPLPPIEPVAADAARHVIVIGAGIIGLASALWLQRCGHRVTLVDRRPPAPGVPYDHACSYGNACTIALHGCVPLGMPGIAWRVPGMLLDPEGPLAISWLDLPALAPWLVAFLRASRPHEAERVAATLASLLALADAGYSPLIEEAGAGDLLQRTGCLYLYKTEAQLAAAHAEMRLRERHGVRMEKLDASGVRDLEPNLAPLYAEGVLFTDSYIVCSPHRLALALAAAIRARGGIFIEGEVDRLSAGPDAVEIRIGDTRHRADRAVVAAGAWSRRLAAGIGDRVLLDTERGYHVLFPEDAGLLRRPVCYPEHGFYMVPMQDGLRAAGTVELGGLGRPPKAARTQTIARVAKVLLPALGASSDEWLGLRPSMPDSLPVIGSSPHQARVIYAFGHGHLGLTLGGITGRLVAELVSGHRPAIDLASLRPDRFGPARPERPSERTTAPAAA